MKEDISKILTKAVGENFCKKNKLSLFCEALWSEKHPVAVDLAGSSLAFFIYAMEAQEKFSSFLDDPLVFVLKDDKSIRKLWGDLSFLWPPEKMHNVFILSGALPLPYCFEVVNENILTGLASLVSLRVAQEISSSNNDEASSNKTASPRHAKSRKFFFISASQLVCPTTPFDIFRQKIKILQRGENYIFSNLRSFLDESGYVRVARVERPGEYVQRGDILDVFSPHLNLPLRLYFFDCELEEIRLFSSETQKSYKDNSFNQVMFCPFQGEIADEKSIDTLLQKMEQWKPEIVENIPVVHNLVGDLLEKLLLLKRSHPFAYNFLSFSGLLHQKKEGWLDHFLALKSSLFFVDPEACLAGMDGVFEHHDQHCLSLREKAQLQWEGCPDSIKKDHTLGDVLSLIHSIFLPAKNVFLARPDWQDIMKKSLKTAKIYTQRLLCENYEKWKQSESIEKTIFDFGALPPHDFGGQWTEIKQSLQHRLHAGEKIWLLSRNAYALPKLKEFFSELNPVLVQLEKKPDEKSKHFKFFIGHGYFQSGFRMPGFSFWMDYEIFGRKAKLSTPQSTAGEAWLDAFFDLKEDDYVVHLNEGIGIYRGLVRLETEEMKKDYLKIEYAEKSFLFVPVEQLSMVQKYVGGDGEKKLSRLGGSAWGNLKKRIKKNVEFLARDLIDLYGKRQSSSNAPLGKDDIFQQEFELRFPFEETPDQLKVVEEIKQDLEKDVVMDRLLCADVGFGKTEVALRAMFKTVMNGFQCAFLVPTTILAMQHYKNFIERFADFPIRVAILNRFVKAADQKEILAQITSGQIDILVATHKVFSSKVIFKNIGLLVIDEEQKFGVKQKERLKQKHPYVNTLSLSATPIPRTLHMSMSGIRDISFIQTPPQGREQIQTHVLGYDEEIIVQAVEREISRGGQVFFVYNFVETIVSMKAALQKMLPKVRMAYVHGQMAEEQLRNVVSGFFDKKIDMLITTTIIENGIDIRNANTLFVHHAHRLGLAQLYQLKGRVGRGDRQAHAYFFYPKGEKLSSSATKRLRFLGEETNLGAGFALAMRDLEIRGAGNLLGPQQSGSIAAVGYELYCKLLQESVNESKKPNASHQDFIRLVTVVDLRYEGFIDDRFLEENVEKIKLYRRIASLETKESVEECKKEIVDRFGPYPEVVEKLLAIAMMRIFAGQAYILSIIEKIDVIEITFSRALLEKKDVKSNVLCENILESVKTKHVYPVADRSDQLRVPLPKRDNFCSLPPSEKKAKKEQFFWGKCQNLMNLIYFWQARGQDRAKIFDMIDDIKNFVKN